MSITDFKVSRYRSIKDVWLKLQPINVIVGPNGTGKSNMYRAVYLVACAARGQLARALAEEGGVKSAVWAGPRPKREKSKNRTIKLSVRVERFEYNLTIGTFGEYPPSPRPMFPHDPDIKKEDVYLINGDQKVQLVKRRRSFVEAKDASGKRLDYTMHVPENESILASLREPHRYPELFQLRQSILDWRFYHHFRTDKESPLRRPQVGVMTPTLSHDGKDLAAAIRTIQQPEPHPAVHDAFQSALEEAFPGADVETVYTQRGLVQLYMGFPGFSKPFDLSELSDGTLQYLCLLTALLSPQPAPVIVINEPETSIHPSLYGPLARLLIDASKNSQVWITTHATELADQILELTGYAPLELEKVKGETRLKGVGLGGYRDDADDDSDDEVNDAEKDDGDKDEDDDIDDDEDNE